MAATWKLWFSYITRLSQLTPRLNSILHFFKSLICFWQLILLNLQESHWSHRSKLMISHHDKLWFFACWFCVSLYKGMNAQAWKTVYADTNNIVIMCMFLKIKHAHCIIITNLICNYPWKYFTQNYYNIHSMMSWFSSVSSHTVDKFIIQRLI